MELPEYHAPRSGVRRMIDSMAGQADRTPRCPDTPRLDGRLAVLTGATGGIGLEIARGLARRGAALILPCRSPEKGERVAQSLRDDAAPGAAIDLLATDLEDLDSVRAGAEAVRRAAAGRRIDVLVENAGIWPRTYAETRQGHEISFGVNVLGHFALRRQLREAGLLEGSRIVVVTGDIYVLSADCTPDFRWRGALGGMQAYCRSNLGNLWIAAELARRHPDLEVRTVHPGVVATNLGGDAGALGSWIKRRLMIAPEQGAQMPLVCATQPGLESGGYWHNAKGRMRLAPDDPAADTASAGKLWETCESLAAGRLALRSAGGVDLLLA
jgi:NAD(P)-dependent dehydrogenase (short-subunit alcohol dehydrogenase family)